MSWHGLLNDLAHGPVRINYVRAAVLHLITVINDEVFNIITNTNLLLGAQNRTGVRKQD